MSRTDPIRVLIVDDSALIRRVLSDLIGSSPDLEVTGTARDGMEAIQQVGRLKPDLVTLDVDMPGLSGLDTIPALLAVHPVPIVMVSALTQDGAETTLTALERGAVDFIPKPDRNQIGQIRANRDLLVQKLRAAVRCRPPLPLSPDKPGSSSSCLAARRELSHSQTTSTSAFRPAKLAGRTARCVVLGISTGGPQTLTRVLRMLVGPIPPLLIVQHMPPQFTKTLASRLDGVCPLDVQLAEDGQVIQPNTVRLAPGSHHLRLTGRPPRVRMRLDDREPVQGHRPSIDVLFFSAALAYQSDVVGILMTGMGRDGVEGCKQILAAGGRTYGQDESTSVVYGMNRVAFVENALHDVFPVDALPSILESIYDFR